MPKYTQTFSTDVETEKAMAIAYEVFRSPGFRVQFAGENKMIGHSSSRFNKQGEQIDFTIEGNLCEVKSEMIHNESFDILKKNKKNAEQFIAEFQQIENTINPEQIANNEIALQSLRQDTITQAEKDEAVAREINEAMNLEGSNIYVTYAIIAINIIVFILMAIAGAGIVTPNPLVHIQWGSNVAPLTLSGDYWRLFTNMFIHFGIIHLLFNMYCLYYIGVYLEPLLGKARYITAYICTGILASITSLWWHTEFANSAGASGAIFGLYGVFFAFLTTKLIPAVVRNSLLKSIGIFIVFNLVYGLKSGVDNSAHIGGLVSGLVIGYLYTIAIQKEKMGVKLSFILPVVIVVSLLITYGYTSTHTISSTERNETLRYMDFAKYKDDDKFTEYYNAFIDMQQPALDIENDKTLETQTLIKKIEQEAIPSWDKAAEVLGRVDQLDVNEERKKMANAALKYVSLRKQEAEAMVEVLKETPGAEAKLEAVRSSVNNALNEMREKNKN